MISSDSAFGLLLYAGYVANREAAPHITLSAWKAVYPLVDEMEAKYQAEKAIEKAAA